tara:strand:+ start:991 stop:1224 length:234 start_codon:yes stop_codon:yes gene_type:complete
MFFELMQKNKKIFNKAWQSTKYFTLVEQYKLKALLNREQDFKNNKNFESPNYRPASNSSTIERGVPNDKLTNSLGGR